MPSSLVKSIRWSSLSLELYDKDATCSRKSRASLATAKITLPSCMCKQVIAAQKQTDGIARPCTVKDTFDLINSNGQVTGTIAMVFRLSCFGNPIVEHFSLHEKSFMLDDSPMQKFLCSSVKKDEETKDENGSKRPVLKRPISPPRVSMNDPAFDTLTMAEKLNDPKYRELVYNTYPDEPTCCCKPSNKSTHPLMCQSGCIRPCCMKLRNPDILIPLENEEAKETLNDTYCIDILGSKGVDRLRGGGDIEQLYMDQTDFNWFEYDPDYTWGDDRHTRRLEGGGNGERDTCSCSGNAVLVPPRKASSKDKDMVAVFDACTPRITSTGPTPGCACPGKDASKMIRGAANCMNKPCQGIDCLIRAFKDAQDFVDSIGKVPGLPGLGLMDPSESPFFGRDIDKDYVPTESLMEKKKIPIEGFQKPVGSPAPVCTAPCGKPVGKLVDETRLPFATMVPPRLGIVREAIPILPEAGSTITPTKHRKKEEKKDEKTDKQKDAEATSPVSMDPEVGPCGEPKCKSRRRKAADNASVNHSVTSTSSKTRNGTKQAINLKVRRKGKYSKRRIQSAGNPSEKERGKKRNEKIVSAAGPAGDRGVTQTPTIPSKKIMRYVYFVGDYYPGINYGHKNCIDVRMRVPANMGWLWNTIATPGNLKPRIGWRPGAIGRSLYELLQDAKESSLPMDEPERGKGGKTSERGKTGTDRRGGFERGKSGLDRGRDRVRLGSERARSAPSRGKGMGRRERSGRATSYQGMQKQSKMEGEEEGPGSPPTLHIHRKDGTYYVTMYPIRQETSAEPRLAEPMKPLQFKIVKNKDDASETSSSTASDMEIEFSPPAAVSKYRKKPDVIHVDTQVRQQEILDAYKAEEIKKKSRRGRREKKVSK